jgi:hypothetical protein
MSPLTPSTSAPANPMAADLTVIVDDVQKPAALEPGEMLMEVPHLSV